MNNIEKTIQFLLKTFDTSKGKPEQTSYRIEHSFRVANIGKRIAENENLNAECFIIACLLHDIGYADMQGNWNEHGRVSAGIARSFLSGLDLSSDEVEEICYGIAIHVDGISDFEGKETIFAGSVSDADNIDRFDAYRIYEGLQYEKFDLLPLGEKKKLVEKKLLSLKKYLGERLQTETATGLWREKIGFQISFFELFMQQLENSNAVT